MRNVLIVGGVALGLYWLWRSQQPATNPINVNPPTSMTGAGQSATVYGPGGVSDGSVRAGTYLDGSAAKAAAKAFAQQPVTSKLSLFRALTSVNAKTPPAPAPAPIPSLSLVHGTTAVTQIT